MKRTYINTRTREAEVLSVRKEGSLTWVGALILEIIFSIAFFYTANLISECAGLWHNEASLGRDLWRYFGRGLSYADRAFKWFGFRKAFGNLILAVICEVFAYEFFCVCIGLESTDIGQNSPSDNIFTLGAFVRIIVYVLITFFSQASYLYEIKDWRFEERYSEQVAYYRTWIVFWVLVCVVLGLIMYAVRIQWNNFIIVACLLFVVALIAISAYLDNGRDVWDLIILIEDIGEKIFRH